MNTPFKTKLNQLMLAVVLAGAASGAHAVIVSSTTPVSVSPSASSAGVLTFADGYLHAKNVVKTVSIYTQQQTVLSGGSGATVSQFSATAGADVATLLAAGGYWSLAAADEWLTTATGAVISPITYTNHFNPAAQHNYAGFKYQPANGTALYGWVDMELTPNPGVQAFGWTVKAWAYETSGGPILTGSFNSVAQIPAVPEPGTWAMMVAGLGALGTLARRRRSA